VCTMSPDRFVPVLLDACTEVASKAIGRTVLSDAA